MVTTIQKKIDNNKFHIQCKQIKTTGNRTIKKYTRKAKHHKKYAKKTLKRCLCDAHDVLLRLIISLFTEKLNKEFVMYFINNKTH